MKIIGGSFSTSNDDNKINPPSYADFAQAGGDTSATSGNPTSVGNYKKYLDSLGIESEYPDGVMGIPSLVGNSGNNGANSSDTGTSGGGFGQDLSSAIGQILEFTPINMLSNVIESINSNFGGQQSAAENAPTNVDGLSFDDELFAEVYGIDPSYLGDLYGSENYTPAQSGGGNDESFIDQINDVGLINAIINNMSAPQGDGNGGGGDGNGGGTLVDIYGGGGGGQPEKDPLDPIYAPIGSGSEQLPTVASPNVDGFFVRPSMLNTIPSSYDPRFAEANNRFLQAQAINPSYLNNVVDMRNFVPVEEQLTSG